MNAWIDIDWLLCFTYGAVCLTIKQINAVFGLSENIFRSKIFLDENIFRIRNYLQELDYVSENAVKYILRF